MVYIAGLYISPARFTQYTEATICASLLASHIPAIRAFYDIRKKAKGTPHAPGTPLAVRIASAVHTLASFAPPLVFTLAVSLNGFRKPGFTACVALPAVFGTGDCGRVLTALVRVLGSVGIAATLRYAVLAARELGTQFFSAGEEKRKVVTTGPYSVVRHPMFATLLVKALLYVPTFWCYTPLVPFAFTAAALAVEITNEERLLEEDESIAAEYREYKQRVPYRLIPYLW